MNDMCDICGREVKTLMQYDTKLIDGLLYDIGTTDWCKECFSDQWNQHEHDFESQEDAIKFWHEQVRLYEQ